MVWNYFKTAWRNLIKVKFYSLLNIAGLTLGLTIGLLILLWVRDERSWDSFHPRLQQLWQVNTRVGTGKNNQVWSTTQGPVATWALRQVPGIQAAVRIHPTWEYSIFSTGEKSLPATSLAYTDPIFFSMLDFPLLQGDPAKPFPNNQSMVITQSTARKYFGNEDPVGKTLTADHTESFIISGVIADFPENSTYQYDMLIPVARANSWYGAGAFWHNIDDDWGNFGYTTILQLPPGANPKAIGDQLTRIYTRQAPHIKVDLSQEGFLLQPMANVHLYAADGTPAGMLTVRIFFVIAVFILLIACINYVNLSTARAILRAREVSIRKIIGAQRAQLFTQFMVESVLFFTIALLLSVALIRVLLPLYNSISGKQLHADLLDTSVWKTIGLTILGSLLAASVYPAILMSSFQPLKALRGRLGGGMGAAQFRKVLVTIQFVFSVSLIIGTLVIGKQLKYVMEQNPGYDRTQVFSLPVRNMSSHLDAVLAGLRGQPGILHVSSADSRIIQVGQTTGDTEWEGKTAGKELIVRKMGIDAAFIPMMKIGISDGKNFTGNISDSAHFILNETAVRMTGMKDPVGRRFKLNETAGTIIGVVKDFNFSSFRNAIEPLIIYYNPQGNRLYVKTTGAQASKAIGAVSKVWQQYNAGFPFSYSFLDEEYGRMYASDQRTSKLFHGFAAIAILISCLGLFGLATYTAQVRTREIGIRKVLGASVGSLITLLSKDFLKLVVLAIAIATPLAWWAMNDWLKNFVYRTRIEAWVFLVAGVSAIGIAVITVSFQSIRAALANPVNSIKAE